MEKEVKAKKQQLVLKNEKGHFLPGNCANPTGRGGTDSRLRLSMNLIKDNAIDLVKAGLDAALVKGDMKILRFFLDRLLPAKVFSEIQIGLGDLDFNAQVSKVLQAVDKSEIDSDKAATLISMLSQAAKIDEISGLRQECAFLRKEIIDLQTMLKTDTQ